MKPIVKKVLPLVGIAALAGLGTAGVLNRDNILYKLYRWTYKYQIKKEDISPS